VQALLVRSPAQLPPDALSLVRFHALELQAEMRRAGGRGNTAWSVESRAHVQDSLSQLTEALRASMLRS
jgi:hypothetical protein